MLKKVILLASITLVLASGFFQLSFSIKSGVSIKPNIALAADSNKCPDGTDKRDFELSNGETRKNTCLSDLSKKDKGLYGQTVCKQSGFSWLVCPIINLLSEAIEAAEKIILELLYNNPLTTGAAGTPENVIYTIWANIRNVANALLVVVFLVMILGNAVSIGIDAYTIKRTLPRLVIAAILMQFSFALCGLLIQITNVVALGILELGNTIISGTRFDTTLSGFTGAGATIGVAVAAGAMLASLLSGAGLILLAAAAISAIGTLITLGLRQLMIIMLVISAPLAILAWILPNTEGLFKTWMKNFTRILFMFPLIAGLFIIARIGSLLANNTPGVVGDVLSFVLIIAPLFAVPFTFKWAGGLMAAGAGAISGYAAGKAGQFKNSKAAKDFQERRRESNLANSATSGTGFRARASRATGKLGAFGVYGTTAGRVGKSSNMRYKQRVAAEGAAAQSAIAGRYQQSLKAGGNRLEAYDFSGTTDAKARNQRAFGSRMVEQIESSRAAYTQATGGDTIGNANDLYGWELEQVARGGSSQVIGASGKDVQMQTAAIAEMSQRGDVGKKLANGYTTGIRGVQASGTASQDTIMSGIGASVGDIMTKAPDIVKGGSHAGTWGKMTAAKIAGLDETSTRMMSDFYSTARTSTEQKDRDAASQILAEAQKIATNKDLHNNLSPEAKSSLNSILGGTGLTIR